MPTTKSTTNPTPYTLSFPDTEDQKPTSAAAAAAGGSGSGAGGSRSSSSAAPAGACAVCKHQRRKCPPDCPLAPHFPAYKQRDFLNVHKLFGVRNLTRALTSIDKRKTHDFMVSVIYEANARAADPVGGCLGLIHNLNNQLKYSALELEIVNQQLAFYRSSRPHQIIADNQGFNSEIPFGSMKLSGGTVMIEDLIKAKEEEDEDEEEDLKNAASKFSLRK